MRRKTCCLPMIASLLFAVSGQALDTLPAIPLIPSDNPMTPAKVALGKQLYFDKRLSSTNEVSCNSCHDVMGNGADRSPFSKGVKGQLGGRNSPTVWNAAYLSVQFWDGRAPSLEEQAKGPMINPVEMGNANHDEVIKKVAAIPGYQKQFTEVFGEGGLTIDNAAKAIAAYERTLVTPDSPYDRFGKGDQKALSKSAQRGLALSQSVGCTGCHSGPNFADPGRFEVTKSEADKNAWRVPTWRNVALTGPYFHNGAVTKLDEAVRVMGKTQLGRDLKPTEVKDLVAFLTSLTGERPRQTPPQLPD